MKSYEFDYIVIGSGIAGLMSALHLSRLGRVAVLTKREAFESNTSYAQGGIACVMTDEDTIDRHVADTLDAGAGLCDESVVRTILTEGPATIEELIHTGIRFSERPAEDGGGFDLGREGGHTKRRVLHAGDLTGREIQVSLLRAMSAQGNIKIIEHCMVIDLITTSWLGLDDANRCVGAYVLMRQTGEIAAVRAPVIVMATGGGGKTYLYTSNPDVATADGVALAWRAGVAIRNMEFIQFHPTCLYHPKAKSFLISEAIRGEGAELVNAAGQAFMARYDRRGSLAPRDIVARAIDNEMKSTGQACVYLDIRHKDPTFVHTRFPNISRTCKQFGIDIARDLIPVVPAAHYFCGGVQAGVDGSTTIPGFYAIGEVACTGLHGANRLASNSLLEGAVCARLMARSVAQQPQLALVHSIDIPDWQFHGAVPSDEEVVVEHNWNEVRQCMWDYVGIVRTDRRLDRAARRIRNLRQEIREYYHDYLVTGDVLELRNIADVAELVIRSAQSRKESRGLHYTLDYPETGTFAQDTLIVDPAGEKV
ncbi:MAG: L-aspartate oxidase [Kiritimatiellia bacterium]